MGVDLVLVWCDRDPPMEDGFCIPDVGWWAVTVCKLPCEVEEVRVVLGLSKPGDCKRCPLRLPAGGILAAWCWPRLSAYSWIFPGLVHAHCLRLSEFLERVRRGALEFNPELSQDIKEEWLRERARIDIDGFWRWLDALATIPKGLTEKLWLFHWG